MSVSMTADAVIERRKTVTRRKGWTFLKPGDRLTLCRKVMGRKPGEPWERLAEVEVVSVAREPLWELTRRDYATTYPPALHPGGRLLIQWAGPTAYASREVAREGFPGMDPAEFVERFFLVAQGMKADDEVTRIEWRYLDGEAVTR